jgi:hypothetical protein
MNTNPDTPVLITRRQPCGCLSSFHCEPEERDINNTRKVYEGQGYSVEVHPLSYLQQHGLNRTVTCPHGHVWQQWKAKAEAAAKDVERLNWMEQMRDDCEGHVLSRCFIPGDNTLRENIDALIQINNS